MLNCQPLNCPEKVAMLLLKCYFKICYRHCSIIVPILFTYRLITETLFKFKQTFSIYSSARKIIWSLTKKSHGSNKKNWHRAGQCRVHENAPRKKKKRESISVKYFRGGTMGTFDNFKGLAGTARWSDQTAVFSKSGIKPIQEVACITGVYQFVWITWREYARIRGAGRRALQKLGWMSNAPIIPVDGTVHLAQIEVHA